jgi:putative chitinase
MQQILKSLYPNAAAVNISAYAKPLTDAMIRYGINTIHRKRAFLAQIGHESGQLSVVVENLNYSAAALRSVFGNYFPSDIEAKKYERKPEDIANIVYAGRMGNTDPGDGWKYRGRGLIQITGKENYSVIGKKLGANLISNPHLLISPLYAAMSAAAWWQNAGLNELSDKLASGEQEAFKAITKRINGGYNGLSDRQKLYERAKKVIV